LLSKVLRETPSGSTHWSVRAAAEETGISKSSVARYFALVQKASSCPTIRSSSRSYFWDMTLSSDHCLRAKGVKPHIETHGIANLVIVRCVRQQDTSKFKGVAIIIAVPAVALTADR
jgi:hypothetical protein